MEENDQIIAFKKYDSSIDANLAKTKLDAHGIPCFLTEENLTNLYPLQNLLLFGVRLHIFSKDQQMAEQVLNDIDNSQDTLTCPACRSQHISLQPSTKFTSRIGRFLIAFFLGMGFPPKKTYHCGDCAREFENL
jgi:uncharacterized protein YlaN (UPF0358 family)